jgi:hypothetical protein
MSDLRDLLVVVALGIIVYYIVFPYVKRSGVLREDYSDSDSDGKLPLSDDPVGEGLKGPSPIQDKTMTISENLNGDAPSMSLDKGSFPAALLEDRRARAPLEASDLLPTDPNSAWTSINPEGQGSIAYKNFIEATTHFGVDTIGSSLKNANLDLRSEYPNPRITVSPWNQSTITFDDNHRQMEIGN